MLKKFLEELSKTLKITLEREQQFVFAGGLSYEELMLHIGKVQMLEELSTYIFEELEPKFILK